MVGGLQTRGEKREKKAQRPQPSTRYNVAPFSSSHKEKSPSNGSL